MASVAPRSDHQCLPGSMVQDIVLNDAALAHHGFAIRLKPRLRLMAAGYLLRNGWPKPSMPRGGYLARIDPAALAVCTGRA